MKIINLSAEQFLEIQTNFLEQTKDISFFSNFIFLQSYQWAKIQESFGQLVFFQGVEEQGKIIAWFIVIEKKIMGKKKYWYIPRGPIFPIDINFSWSDFFSALNIIAKKNKLSFIRLEPVRPSFTDFLKQSPKNLFKTSDLQPQNTSFLELSLGSEKILAQMAPKTRYNIRLAYKKGIKVVESDLDDFDKFWHLMSITSKRDNFFIHSKKYYYNLIKNGSGVIKFFSAKLGDRTLAVGLFSFLFDTVSYLHGASDNTMRNVMAPYALQWEIIDRAIAENYKYYDFYGVDEKKWPGVSRFKKGFAGKSFSFLGTFDFVIETKFYLCYKFIRQINKLIRHYI
ncbi:MAG TPA: peptidoglycan bridge formation glycyltransferase FemA/FemB family protein [bacterium]|nr:peptidoglycan bridge formation glycyltransferase FemA/FemB family protein [bacterium]